jgi:hypothetical protein
LIVAGGSVSSNGPEAFRWTAEAGMVGMGDLPGDVFWSEAFDVSADGSTAVGWSFSGPPTTREAFVWTEAAGMHSLRDLLMSDFGLKLKDWTLFEATGISDDGLTIVGWGQSPTPSFDAWIVKVPWLGPCIHGDMNRDEQVDAADIVPFIDALLSMPDVTPADRCTADVNADYEIDGHDIQSLVDKMLL